MSDDTVTHRMHRTRSRKPALFNDFIWPVIVLLGQILNGWRAERNYSQLPEVLPTLLKELPGQGAWPGISVIIPARNEAKNLPRLLNSLVRQDYPLYEVIVVDDASTDDTADVVRRYAAQGVRLIAGDGPPEGWTGKNAACWLGAGESIYPWLLFVDADTELSPSALRASIAFAVKRNVSALSLFAQQRCETFPERLLLPFAYQQYFVGVNERRIHSPHSPHGPALANGQYFLIARAAYEQVGGHAANAGSIIDDVALATTLKKAGIIPLACRGEKLVAVRMYTGLPAIILGFGKNSYLFLRKSPSSGIQTAVSTSLAASVLILCMNAFRKRSWRIGLLAFFASIAQMWNMRSWIRRFGVSPWYALLAPLSALGFLGIALHSMFHGITGRPLPWKNRTYSSSSTRRNRVRYRLPRPWIIPMGRALLTKTPRSIISDSAMGVAVLPKPPIISGQEHIPQQGSFVLVANHYQRLDLWIGWAGAVLIDAIAKQRDVDMHMLTTDRARIGRMTVPGTRWIIERVAAVWGLVLFTPPAVMKENGNGQKAQKGQKGQKGQKYALLRMMRLLNRSDGRDICIGMMPEGDEGNASGLKDALPGSGRALAALSAKGLPIIPAAVWEAEGRLHARFGEPMSITKSSSSIDAESLDMLARTTVMQIIAALLPPHLRGKYGLLKRGAVL